MENNNNKQEINVTNNKPSAPVLGLTHLHKRSLMKDNIPDGVVIPPLTTKQYVALKNFNIAAQVVSYGITAMVGALVGIVLTKNPWGGAVGAVVGVMWGAYEASCISSIQDKFDQAYQSSNSIHIWREKGTLYDSYGAYGGIGDTYSLANGPLSAVYVGMTVFMLTGKIP